MLELEPAEWFDRLLFCAAQQKQIKVRGFHDSLIISALSKKVPNTNIELMQEIGKVFFGRNIWIRGQFGPRCAKPPQNVSS